MNYLALVRWRVGESGGYEVKKKVMNGEKIQ